MGIFSSVVMRLGTPGLHSRSATEWHSVILPPSMLAFPQQLSSLLFSVEFVSDAEQEHWVWDALGNGALIWPQCFGITAVPMMAVGC